MAEATIPRNRFTGPCASVWLRTLLLCIILDHWNFDFIWLPVMYLSSLDIRILDGSSSEVLATARFNAAMNTFPHSQTVVAKLFTQLDQQNQSLVAAAN